MSQIASILHHDENEICFKVDEVDVFKNLLPLQTCFKQLEKRLNSSLIAFSHDENFEVIEQLNNSNLHSLVNAVHQAFAEHRPLLLTPDAIWMAIAEGFAQHINNNAERLRYQFVSHSSKRELKVAVEKLTNNQDWQQAVELWSKLIDENVKADIADLMVCDFSTTTPIIRTASQVVMMDALKQYFDYGLYAICGIPWIIVLGSIDDWQKIRERVAIISQYDLDWWTKRLLPICDGFIETVAGKPSLEFWQHICKPQSMYGGDVITGWLADLFPYLKDDITKSPTYKNPILETPREELTINHGIPPRMFPNGISQASFSLSTLQGESHLELIAGFIGVCQNQQTGCLHPEIGWGIRQQDNFVGILNKLEKEHQLNSPTNWEFEEGSYMNELPADLIQLLERFDGGTLFANTEHPWNIKAFKEYTPCKITDNKVFTIFIQLKDNRCIAFANIRRKNGKFGDKDYRTWFEWWIVVGKPILIEDKGSIESKSWILKPESTKMIAKGIPQLFERIIQAEGRYYFDAEDFIADESIQILS
ncbi:hypothetical protein Riv7116_6566 [Rivularia sp. PCC 7116]|uniref:DUF4419 domain-containing protein n=1 Tax=Rivularia sp. PCC 7116 TaxID=373994 RepID=UPI00029F39BB|nr:DUF4419 domain-containing protein [Rivularia sp. PCC 7116]AFY58894.1 hypothetical protein Riv7116_6566 [Rivularia sp. PCC 7116]